MQNEVILDPVQGNEPSMISTVRLHLQNILYKQNWSYCEGDVMSTRKYKRSDFREADIDENEI